MLGLPLWHANPSSTIVCLVTVQVKQQEVVAGVSSSTPLARGTVGAEVIVHAAR